MIFPCKGISSSKLTRKTTTCSDPSDTDQEDSPPLSAEADELGYYYAFQSSPYLRGPCIFTEAEDANKFIDTSNNGNPLPSKNNEDKAVYKKCSSFEEARDFIGVTRSSCSTRDNNATTTKSQLNDKIEMNGEIDNPSTAENGIFNGDTEHRQNEPESEPKVDEDEEICDIRGEETSGTYLNLGKWEGDWSITEAKAFDKAVEGNAFKTSSSASHYKSLLRRTRAVTILTNRLRLARTEDQCYEVVTRLIVSLFNIERCTFAILKDKNRFFVKQCSCKKMEYAPDLKFSWKTTNLLAPVKGTAIEIVRDTRELFYTPNLLETQFKNQRGAKAGMRTALLLPLIINAGEKNEVFSGTLNITTTEIDAFSPFDILLAKDIAQSFEVAINMKRLQRAKEISHQKSKLLLTSMIPEQILPKIEKYWEVSLPGEGEVENDSCDTSVIGTDEHLSNPSNHFINGSSTPSDETTRSRASSIGSSVCLHNLPQTILERSSTNESRGENGFRSSFRVNEQLHKSSVLYAEEQKGVSIIFADIVRFSHITQKLEPLQVMQMLQSMFDRFDKLCKIHRVKKLETIGDAYICCTGLYENGEKDEKADALRCLQMAKNMVIATQDLLAPTDPPHRLEIRVGMHVGTLGCGVLGKSIPKFSVYGDAVNMAARMEQTSYSNKIHVSKEFHDLIDIGDDEYEKNRVVDIKNMGQVETWIIDPLEEYYMLNDSLIE